MIIHAIYLILLSFSSIVFFIIAQKKTEIIAKNETELNFAKTNNENLQQKLLEFENLQRAHDKINVELQFASEKTTDLQGNFNKKEEELNKISIENRDLTAETEKLKVEVELLRKKESELSQFTTMNRALAAENEQLKTEVGFLRIKEGELTNLTGEHRELATENEGLKAEVVLLRKKEIELGKNVEFRRELSTENEKLKAEIDFLRKKNEETVATLRNMLQENKVSFQALASEIAKKTYAEVKGKSEEDLTQIVKPLKKEIDVFNSELKNHMQSNSATINNFRGMFEQFTKNIAKNEHNTAKLTDALLGNNKTQGNWGEWTLERVLQSAGLQKEVDYKLQEHYVEEERIKRPDVVIYLPDDKHVIVDAKMSLLHYYEYVNSEENREQNLKALKNSIAGHIKDLAAKKYSDAQNLDSISMVFLFIPIESLFQLLATDFKVMDFSYKHKIVLVSPTTLYSSLYAIAYVRRLEKQTENINNIVEEVGKFYDKCCAFLEDFVMIGKALNKASETYEGSLNKLQTGKGNIVDRMVKIKKMGISSKKEIPEVLQKELVE